MHYIDSHAHLQDERLNSQIEAVLKRAVASDVRDIIVVGYNIQSSKEAVKLTKHDMIHSTIGVHPHDSKFWNDDSVPIIIELLENNKVVGLGEIGLDYYYNFSERKIQKKVFVFQLELAEKLQIPIIVHSRNAMVDVMDILNEFSIGNVLLHSFEGSVEQVEICIDRNYYVSFNGITTFKKSDRIDIIKRIPLGNILFETDCPYLSPVPKRGKLNEPSYLPYIAKFISENTGVDLDCLKKTVYENTTGFFKLNENK